MNNTYTLTDLKQNKFSLVLSGGSAYGFTHLGVIKFVEENNLIPNEIIGTSMGALIGAFYALGYNFEHEEEIVKHIKWYKLVSLKYGQSGFRGQKIYNFLKEFFKDKTLKDTKIPLKIVATETNTGNAKVFTKDDNITILDAVMASISIPGIFTPYKIDNNYYIDGFVASNLPIEFAKKNNIIFANNVESISTVPKMLSKKRFFRKFKNTINILKKTYLLMVINQSKEKIKNTENLLLIEPNLKGFYRSSFSKWDKLSQIGYNETKKYFEN